MLGNDRIRQELVPRQLIELNEKRQQLKALEPTYLQEEGIRLDDEWTQLTKERDGWTEGKQILGKEEVAWKEQEERLKQEDSYCQEEKGYRTKKIQEIEKDLETHSQAIDAREVFIRSQQHYQKQMGGEH